jgi:muramoyltetrapeptide carboxypeptidase LdcA involved in peptidoglycan recycling
MRVRAPAGSTRSSCAQPTATDLPVAAGLDFAYTDPQLTLSWGVRARLDAGAEVTIALLEAAVV